MSNFQEKQTLGRTGLLVGRLGIASSYRASAAAYEEAFEQGCNYFTWGSFIKGRDPAMGEAIRNIVASGKRDKLVIGLLSYSHSAFFSKRCVMSALKALKIDAIDVLLLGYYSKRPPQKMLDRAADLKKRGLINHIGMEQPIELINNAKSKNY